METKKEYLKKRIIETVFKKEEIQKVAGFSGVNTQWLMDFKANILDPDFAEAYVSIFKDVFNDLGDFQVCGLESGAIPLVTIIRMMVPKCKNAFYIRKSRKKSDLANLIEGSLEKNLPIVIVDDILNRGNSLSKQLVILSDLGHNAQYFFSIVRYRDENFYQDIMNKGLSLYSIFELNDFKAGLQIENLSDRQGNFIQKHDWKGVWKLRLSQPNPYHVIPKSAPFVDSERLYVGSDDGVMRAINKIDGSVLWEKRIAFRAGGKAIYSSPVVSNGKVFFGAYDGNFYCLESRTGKVLWVFMDADWIGSSPAVSSDGRVVYIGLEFGLFKKRGGVAAIDTETGKAKWTYYQMEGLTHASPAVNSYLGVVVCGCNDGYVYCFDSRNGKLLWKYKTEGEVKYGAIFEEKNGLVIIAGMDGSVYVLKSKTGELYHAFSARFGFYSSPVLHEGKIIIGSLDKYVYCFDLFNKVEVWKLETNGRIFATPVIFENNVFVGSNDGKLYEINSLNGRVESSVQLSERIVNRVSVERKKNNIEIYIATHACEVYKFTSHS